MLAFALGFGGVTMKFILSFICLFLISSGTAWAEANAGKDKGKLEAAVSPRLLEHFPKLNEKQLDETFHGYDACFIMFEKNSSKYFVYHPERCEKRLSPCSTFKIPNSLAGLDSGVLKNENHVFKWDGIKHDINDWNRDQTLQSAMIHSCVWYYQKVAASVGAERMQDYLNKSDYGNKDITSGITTFWLGNSLKISAKEQVEFLKRLIDDQLPFSARSMAITRGLLRLNSTELGTLYGKTGTDGEHGKYFLGWFVGYVVRADGIYVFATNMEGDGARGPKARQLCETLFKEVGLM